MEKKEFEQSDIPLLEELSEFPNFQDSDSTNEIKSFKID